MTGAHTEVPSWDPRGLQLHGHEGRQGSGRGEHASPLLPSEPVQLQGVLLPSQAEHLHAAVGLAWGTTTLPASLKATVFQSGLLA